MKKLNCNTWTSLYTIIQLKCVQFLDRIKKGRKYTFYLIFNSTHDNVWTIYIICTLNCQMRVLLNVYRIYFYFYIVNLFWFTSLSLQIMKTLLQLTLKFYTLLYLSWYWQHPQGLNYILIGFKTRRGSPVDRRPSTVEAPPVGKIHPFSKIALTLESVMWFDAHQDLEPYKRL